MRKILILTISLLSFVGLSAQNDTFSDSAVVSLLTCSPGEEVYAQFGHTGIRVVDPLFNKDIVFNYGIFSFDTDNFYYKFIKGETDYLLGVQQTADFLYEYDQRDSQVWEQVLNLTTSEKRKIIDALLLNYKPENREYRYNFVFDNCATRPRDQIMSSVNGYVRLQESRTTKTYRQWVADYVGNDTWLSFGIDLVFGVKADNQSRQFESMFLPEILMTEFEKAKIIDKDQGAARDLVSQNNVLLYSMHPPKPEDSFFAKPFFLFLVLLFFVALTSVYEIRNKKHFYIIDSVLLFVTGVAGIIIAYLMFISIHPLVSLNFNILWLNPLNIVAAFLIWFKSLRKPMFVYQLVNISFLLLALIALALSFQVFTASAFPIIVILLLRYSTWVAMMKRKLFKSSKFQVKGFGGR